MNNEELNVFNTYNEALTKGNYAEVFATMAEDIVWHQPGNHPLSGTITGKKALGEHLGSFSQKSGGTFRVVTNWASGNSNFVAANVTFVGEQSNGKQLNMNGIDLFRIEKGLIQEVWLFSSKQTVEDEFWK